MPLKAIALGAGMAMSGVGAAEVVTEREDATLAFINHPGIQYSRAINASGWKASSSVFECTLQHSVPYFGDVVFRTRAGEASGSYLRSKVARFSAGEAELKTLFPLWKPEKAELDLGKVQVKKGTRPLWLGSKETEQMLAHLNAGREISISRAAWFTPSETQPAELSISNIGFREEYRRYLDCLAGLLPANFQQLKRTSLYFPSGKPSDKQEELSASSARKLDHILKLVEKDNKIRLFYIDGHTDSVGDRSDNLELSKNRAELVQAYLERRGVPKDWMKTRWHGERYPVASNGTSSGRAKNRRVTVRLERIEEIKVLPLGKEK